MIYERQVKLQGGSVSTPPRVEKKKKRKGEIITSSHFSLICLMDEKITKSNEKSSKIEIIN